MSEINQNLNQMVDTLINGIGKDLKDLDNDKLEELLRKINDAQKCNGHLETPPEDAAFPLMYTSYYKALIEHMYARRRKVSHLPYFPHLIGVCRILMTLPYSNGNDDLYAVALLHDYIEDCVKTENREQTFYWIKEKFNENCSKLIHELTSDESEKREYNGKEIVAYKEKDDEGYIQEKNKTNYINNRLLKMSSDALIIKLADMLDNLGDINIKNEKSPAFRERISSHVKFISENMDKFAPKFLEDHYYLLNAIKRLLYFYETKISNT